MRNILKNRRHKKFKLLNILYLKVAKNQEIYECASLNRSKHIVLPMFLTTVWNVKTI